MECAPTSCVHKCTHHRRSRSCHLAGTAMVTGSRASRIMRPIWSWGNGDHLSSELYLVDAVQIRCYLPHKKHDCHLISHQLRGSKNPLFSWWDDGKGHTRENPCWIGDCAMEESPYARGACSWGHYVQDWVSAGFEPSWGLPKCGNSWTGNSTSRCFSHDLVHLNGTNFMFHVFSQILLGYAGFLYVTTDPPKKKTYIFFYICRHLKLLAHVISGLRPSLEDIAEAVECFLYHSRPRGKSLPTGF